MRSDEDRREAWAEELLDRLTPMMSALGVLFLFVVLGEQVARSNSTLSTLLAVTGWVLWVVFALEFVVRLIRAVRVLRTGRVLSSVVRSSRSALSALGGRVGWLAVISAITILGSSQLLYEFGDYDTYAESLHAAALAAITGEPLGQPDGFIRIVEVLLAIFSVVVFATLAGTLGAYFLETRPLPQQD